MQSPQRLILMIIDIDSRWLLHRERSFETLRVTHALKPGSLRSGRSSTRIGEKGSAQLFSGRSPIG